MQNPTTLNIYNLLKDVNNLYVTTKDKRVESLFVKISQAVQSDLSSVVTWIRDILKKNRQGNLGIRRIETFETILHLLAIRKSYPTGFTGAEFATNIAFDPKLKFYVPTIILFRKAQEQKQFKILLPFDDILSSTRGFSTTNEDPSVLSQITIDLEILEDDFVEFNRSEASAMRAYEDKVVRKKRITKKEQILNLVDYLSRRFASEIGMAFEQAKFIDPVGIAANPGLLKDPITLVVKLFPNFSKYQMNPLVHYAKDITKNVLDNTEPQYYNMAYNYIRNRIFQATGAMSADEFNAYVYRANLDIAEIGNKDNDDEDDDSPEETLAHTVNSNVWINANTIVLLACTLYIMQSKAG